VLFELICHRYERRSLLVTSNQPFREWDEIAMHSCSRRPMVRPWPLPSRATAAGCGAASDQRSALWMHQSR